MKQLLIILIFVLFGGMLFSQTTLYRGRTQVLTNVDIIDGNITAGDTSFVWRMPNSVQAWSIEVIATRTGGEGDFDLQVSNDKSNWVLYDLNSDDTFDASDQTFFYRDDSFAWDFLRIRVDTMNMVLNAWIEIK